jgi:hypothetical protein
MTRSQRGDRALQLRSRRIDDDTGGRAAVDGREAVASAEDHETGNECEHDPGELFSHELRAE